MDWTGFDTRLAAYVVVVEGADILLALWNEAERPLWTMPGGGVDLDESPEQGAVREVLEETGFHVELEGLLGIDCIVIPAERRQVHGDRPLKAIRVVYRGRVVGGSLAKEIDGTTDEARWIPLAEVPGIDRVGLVDLAIAMWRATVR